MPLKTKCVPDGKCEEILHSVEYHGRLEAIINLADLASSNVKRDREQNRRQGIKRPRCASLSGESFAGKIARMNP